MLVLQMAHQLRQELHIVDHHVVLERIPNIPAHLAPAVFFTLRITGSKLMAIGRLIQDSGIRSAVTVQHDDQRSFLRQVVWYMLPVNAFQTITFHSISRRVIGLRTAGCRGK